MLFLMRQDTSSAHVTWSTSGWVQFHVSYHMRISTFNLARCKPGASQRTGSLRRIMSEIDADVFVLTETFLTFTPGDGYELIACTSEAPDRTPEERWTCIWSRIGGESLPTSSDPERMTAALVPFATTTGFCVVGTVLPWLADKRHPTLSGSDSFCNALHTQAAEWQALIAKHGQICVAGDFNQDLLTTGHYYGSLRGRTELRSVIASLGLRCVTGGEHDPIAHVPGRACIDHICVSDHLQTSSSTPSRVYPSPGALDIRITDHYASVVELA